MSSLVISQTNSHSNHSVMVHYIQALHGVLYINNYIPHTSLQNEYLNPHLRNEKTQTKDLPMLTQIVPGTTGMYTLVCPIPKAAFFLL